MTTPDVPPLPLTLAFPTPGPLLGAAYRDLYLAEEGSDHQKTVIGDPSLLPRPWDPPTCRDPQLRAELWAWLDAVVVWFNHQYTWDPSGIIPPCWPQHPHLVHEIAVLADQRRRAGLATNSNPLEEWHRYTAPGLTERLHSRLKAHCEQNHQPWPARSRHVRHTDQQHEGERRRTYDADVQALAPQQPSIPTRPRLALLDTKTGEIIEK